MRNITGIVTAIVLVALLHSIEQDTRARMLEQKIAQDQAWQAATAPIFDSLDPTGALARTPATLVNLLNPCDERRHDLMRTGRWRKCHNNKPLPSQKVQVFVELDGS